MASHKMQIWLVGADPPRETAPGATDYTVGGGGSIGAGTYSFRLVAWNDPREINLDLAGPLYFELAKTGVPATYEACDFDGVVCAAGSKTITFNWALPRTPCDHFSLYYQSGSLYSGLAPGTLLARISSHLTTYQLSSLLPVPTTSETLYVRSVDTSGSDDIIYVDGNQLVSFGPGTSFTASAGGPYTVNASPALGGPYASYLDYDQRGLQTAITVSGSVTVGAGGTIVAGRGPATFLHFNPYDTATGRGIGVSRDYVELLTVTQGSPVWQQLGFTDYSGKWLPRGRSTACPLRTVVLSVPWTGPETAERMKRLATWAGCGARVILFDVGSTSAPGALGPYSQLKGQLAGAPWLGGMANTEQVWQIPINVDEVVWDP